MSVGVGISGYMTRLDFAELTTSAQIVDGQLQTAGPFSKIRGYPLVNFYVAGCVLAPRGHPPIKVAVTVEPPDGEWHTRSAWFLREPHNYTNNQAIHYLNIAEYNCNITKRGVYVVDICLDDELAQRLEFRSEDPIGPPPPARSQASISPPPNGPTGDDEAIGELGKQIQKMAESTDEALRQQNQDDGQQGGDYYYSE